MSVKYQVDLQELKDAIKVFTKVAKGDGYLSETVFDFLLDKIEITFNGSTIEVSSKGVGKGRARINSEVMTSINYGLKYQKDIKIWVEDNFIHIGTMVFKCDWIVASGFKTTLDQADEDFENIIKNATEVLQPPHISSESLKSFVINEVRREV